MKVSVIISTYNKEEWLRKVLVGFSVQTEKDFEIVIADDGSTESTKAIIDSFSGKFQNPIIHVWQPDNGFQKPMILNRAIVKSNADYLIFTDGDCIPRNDFVETHVSFRQKGHFLSGGYLKLPMLVSEGISDDDIRNQHCFDLVWLHQKGLPKSTKNNKLAAKGQWAKLMNHITPTRATWNGHNASGWKSDLVSVNGFNQDMAYGGEDRELGERLFHIGIRPKQIRYSAVVVHLDHERKYATPEAWEKNNAIRKYNRKHSVKRIENGIDRL
ncbi:glycosyltransferase family 2 protein [Flavobacterium silvaticum]|uniref:Glycosyltransferase n=1 Tax=Flavobacterium silvaticum TaxID=1852020 RepID=A0A972FWC1_9FLAO|nr:glycosyltransferase family 2 protein [Flavobacterium silvaticum]NMH29227.1 glycosyltransferase [Flavobacterium silvaticum]